MTRATRAAMLEERRLLRSLFAQLRPDQWAHESLCAGWTVRDVGAHLIAWDDLLIYRTRREFVARLTDFSQLYTRSLGSMTRVNRHLADRVSQLSTAEITERFGADDAPALKWLFDRVSPGAHLTEYVLHRADICEPLGLAWDVPADRMVAALQGATKLPDVRLSALMKLRRTRFEATDVEWAAGRGSVVRAPAKQLLLTLAGRVS